MKKKTDTTAYLVAMQLQREVEGGPEAANFKVKKTLQPIHQNIPGAEEIQLFKVAFKLGLSFEMVEDIIKYLTPMERSLIYDNFINKQELSIEKDVDQKVRLYLKAQNIQSSKVWSEKYDKRKEELIRETKRVKFTQAKRNPK